MQETPIYASIGSLIIDDIIYADGTKVKDILGGGGVFAIYGMRIWHKEPTSKDIGYIIHTGFDYPKEIDYQIKNLNISLIDIKHSDKYTTRGLNTFSANDHRDFEYKHPIIRTTTKDFPDNWIKSIKILHLISSPERAIEIIDEWKQREITLNSKEQTEFLWEPLPWACLPENLNEIYNALKRTEIITPNHEEIADMLGLDFKQLLKENNNDFKACVEYCASKFLDGIDHSNVKALVVRASKYGTFVVNCDSNRTQHWIPAYWSWWIKKDQEHVIDVTGAGNAFCGGFAYGWINSNGNALEAAYYGAISASFVVEQMGVPLFSSLDNNNNNNNEIESWNSGPNPIERLTTLKSSEKLCKFI